jgi:SnoaL-like domain
VTSWSVISLLSEYCNMLDHQRWEDWADLFASDGRMELHDGNAPASIAGRDRLIRFAERSPRGVHISGVPALTDSAGVLRSVSPWTFLNLATGQQRVGYYHDEFIDTPAGLRFLLRRVEMMNGST